MPRSVALLSAFFCALWTNQLQAEIPADRLTLLKSSTVFVKAFTALGEQTGSGFLIHRDGNTGFVVTTAHVIHNPPISAQRIECVFQSGEAGEWSAVATVAGIDLNRDLAILKLQGAKLPDPVPTSASVTPTETSSVFIFGFPFGEALSTSRRSPAMTVSSAHVSSIRLDDQENIAFIQLDGGIDPGISGGPIVTKDGSLVGIAVARIVGSGVGIAIPAADLTSLLLGRLRKLTLVPGQGSEDTARFDVAIELSDPLRRVRDVELLLIRKKNLQATAERQADGVWSVLPGQPRSVTLPVAEGNAAGQIEVSLDARERTATRTRFSRLTRMALGVDQSLENSWLSRRFA